MPHETETIIAGATCQWLHDRRVAIITGTSITDPEIRARFYDYLLNLNKNWPADQPILILYNTLSAGVNITSYDRQRMQELTDWVNEQRRTARSAILVNKGFMSSVLYPVLEMVINRERKRQGDRILTRFFYDQPSALAWLKEFLPGS